MTDQRFDELVQAQQAVGEAERKLRAARHVLRGNPTDGAAQRGVEEAHEAWLKARAVLARLQEVTE